VAPHDMLLGKGERERLRSLVHAIAADVSRYGLPDLAEKCELLLDLLEKISISLARCSRCGVTAEAPGGDRNPGVRPGSPDVRLVHGVRKDFHLCARCRAARSCVRCGGCGEWWQMMLPLDASTCSGCSPSAVPPSRPVAPALSGLSRSA